MSDGCGHMAATLYEAARSGDVVEVRGMVAAGSDVEERGGDEGGTPLHVAAEEGHVGVMRVLLEMDAEKEAKAADGSTLLHQAAHNGHVEAMELLVQMGVDEEAKDANGRTPLHHTAHNGQVEAMELLVQMGVEEAKDDNGGTPLHWAAHNGHVEAMQLLQCRWAWTRTRRLLMEGRRSTGRHTTGTWRRCGC